MSRKKTKRLCMVVHGPFPPDPRVSRAIGVAREKGWEVDLLATRQPGQAPAEPVEGAHVIRLPVEHRWGAGVAGMVREYLGFTLLATLRAARLTRRRRYRAMHVNNPPDFLIVAALVPKLLGAKVIFDVHDLSPDMFAMRFAGRRGASAINRILLVVERIASWFADVVLTVHEPYRRELVERGVPPEKITVVMNAVDERLVPEGAARREPVDDGFLVVYHGTITPHYGVDVLIEAIARVSDEEPDAQLAVYGNGDAVPELQRRVHELRLTDRVELSGRFLSQREVISRLRSASVGVIPNLPIPLNRFALSTKLFEYVALGVPVVSSDLQTIKEHFDDSEILFFQAGDAQSLAAALLAVRRDPAGAATRARAALERYEEYRWPRSARRYADLLERCAPDREPSLSEPRRQAG